MNKEYYLSECFQRSPEGIVPFWHTTFWGKSSVLYLCKDTGSRKWNAPPKVQSGSGSFKGKVVLHPPL